MVSGYALRIKSQYNTYKFKWLETRYQNLEKTVEEMTRVIYLKDQWYLSKDIFEILLQKADEYYESASFIYENKKALDELNGLIQQIE